MELWTYQHPHFSLTHGRVDAGLSEYRGDPTIMAAYQELWRRLDTIGGQIVWCYTKHGSFPLTGTIKREWHLSVPPDKAIAFLDDLVWNRIIGIRSRGTADMHRKWKQEASELFPHDVEARHRHEKQRLDQFWDEPEPPEGWRHRLIVPARAGESISAVIPHPVPHSWVVAERLVSSSLNHTRRSQRHRNRDRGRPGSGPSFGPARPL